MYRANVNCRHANTPQSIAQGKRTCIAGQKQIVQLMVVVVIGRYGGGGGVKLDLLEHLRRQRIRFILRTIKNGIVIITHRDSRVVLYSGNTRNNNRRPKHFHFIDD